LLQKRRYRSRNRDRSLGVQRNRDRSLEVQRNRGRSLAVQRSRDRILRAERNRDPSPAVERDPDPSRRPEKDRDQRKTAIHAHGVPAAVKRPQEVEVTPEVDPKAADLVVGQGHGPKATAQTVSKKVLSHVLVNADLDSLNL